jgi:energy-coupling factor transport system permease protein
MHPIIHIVSFLILAISLSVGGVAQLLLALVLVGAYYLFVPHRNLFHLWIMLLRLRWLWLSLLVVYLWFTPGEPLLQSYITWSPTWEGLFQGAWRIGILLVIASSAHLLMQLHSMEQMVAAIYHLAYPMTWLGLSRDRFALRMMLVLERVTEVKPLQLMSTECLSDRDKDTLRRNAIVRISQAVTRLFQQVIERAESEPVRELQFCPSDMPSLWQWLVPVALACGFWWIGFL